MKGLNRRETKTQRSAGTGTEGDRIDGTFTGFQLLTMIGANKLCVARSLPLIALLFLIGSACSFPNMADPNCDAARTVVRELYSQHFAGDMSFSPEALSARERFLTPEFVERLKAASPQADPFTQTAGEPPTAFNVGRCRADAQMASIEVLLFWKTDSRSEQQKLSIEAVKQDDRWLVNSITRETPERSSKPPHE